MMEATFFSLVDNKDNPAGSFTATGTLTTIYMFPKLKALF